MAVEIPMPQLSQTTDEVRLIRWLVSPGDVIGRGDALFEVENDKTTMEVESFTRGTVLDLRGEEEGMIAAGTVIAVVGEPGETPPAGPTAVSGPRETLADANADPAREAMPEVGGWPLGARSDSAVGRLGPLPEGVWATRLVQNIAHKRGVDLRLVEGSGASTSS